MNTQKRYSPLAVTLHWLIALIILAETVIGVGFLHEMPGTVAKIPPLSIHLVLGFALLALMVLRTVVRFTSPRPDHSQSGPALLRAAAAVSHFLLYLFTFLVALSGVVLAHNSHVLQLVVGESVRLPMQFEPFLHAALFVLFGLVVMLHVAAAFYHQFILRDNLLSRMWYDRPRRVARVIEYPAGQ